jgi:NAD(P)-dependent dehydrogenase (short-subunit alcohol dehydrogenase family)
MNILVTGGSKGIGKELVNYLSENNSNRVFFTYNRTAPAILKSNCEALKVDFESIEDVELLIGKLDKLEIDILINNVGGGGNWGSEFIEKTNYKVWSEVNAKNVGAAIKLITLSIPYMKKQKWGRIITIGSISAKKGIGRPWYVLAKKSEIVLSKTLSVKRELVRNGITFNTISPGAIMISDTGWDKRRKENPSAFKKLINKKFPMGRLGRPEEIASIFPYLCSNESRFINGADICIDGGQSNEEYED